MFQRKVSRKEVPQDTDTLSEIPPREKQVKATVLDLLLPGRKELITKVEQKLGFTKTASTTQPYSVPKENFIDPQLPSKGEF